MIWLSTLLAGLAASAAREEAGATRSTARAETYTGPCRRRNDAIEIEARVIDDAPALLLETEP